MIKKSTYLRIFTGIKKGYSTPNLPNNILKLHNHPLIRIFRVVSGISDILLITKRIHWLGQGFLFETVLCLCLFNIFLYVIYSIYITYHRVKHMKRILKNGDLEVRNSPLDK